MISHHHQIAAQFTKIVVPARSARNLSNIHSLPRRPPAGSGWALSSTLMTGDAKVGYFVIATGCCVLAYDMLGGERMSKELTTRSGRTETLYWKIARTTGSECHWVLRYWRRAGARDS